MSCLRCLRLNTYQLTLWKLGLISRFNKFTVYIYIYITIERKVLDIFTDVNLQSLQVEPRS